MNTIRSIRAPLLVLVALAVLGAASLAWSAQALPPRVASHFNAEGKPDGWMTRVGYLEAMSAVGCLVPLSMLASGLAIAIFPSTIINLPRRDYWLSPERRQRTNRYFARHMAWLACGVSSLFLAVNWLVVEANREATPRLSNSVWLLLAVFLTAVAIWAGVLIKHFAHTTA